MYERFVQLLQENGMSAYAVSKATGITQSTLSAWKYGGKLRSGTIKIIADYFGVSPQWLKGESDERGDGCGGRTGPVKGAHGAAVSGTGSYGVESEQVRELINGDEELTDFLEMLVTRPECRMLFSISKDATREDVEFAVKMVEELRNRRKDD